MDEINWKKERKKEQAEKIKKERKKDKNQVKVKRK